jgi:hypothetical protein
MRERIVLAVCAVLAACGRTEEPSLPIPPELDAGGDAPARTPTLLDESELPTGCDAHRLRITRVGVVNEYTPWGQNNLVWPTSWGTFRSYTMLGPLAALTGAWGVGTGNSVFLHREARPLDTVLVVENASEPMCVAGQRRAIRNGGSAIVQLDGLGPLRCTGPLVSGELRYCTNCKNDSAALEGELEGETVDEVTGDRDSRDSVIYLRLGFSVLVARTRATSQGRVELVSGAYLGSNNRLYCVGAISGPLPDGARGDVTFSAFRRADSCQPDAIELSAEACAPQFALGEDW